ncbi:MAG: hypothetical protein L6M37_02095 [Candidatus Methylarchaceae archaeon HK02M1]|nr:hypothetical protein [Candidatus Methylarchaceae archaeon HK02M1]
MSQEQKNLNVAITYGELKVEFSGEPQHVAASVNEFLAKHIHNIELASKVTMNYSLNELIDLFGDYVKITPEGPKVWKGERKLSDKNTLGLQLVAARINYELARASTPSITLNEIKSATALNPKSISSRMSEMLKRGDVEREQSEEGVSYRITTQGIHWLSKVLMKKAEKF